MHGSLPGLTAGRFGVIMFFSACRLPSFAPERGGPAVTCIRESNHHRVSGVTQVSGSVVHSLGSRGNSRYAQNN